MKIGDIGHSIEVFGTVHSSQNERAYAECAGILRWHSNIFRVQAHWKTNAQKVQAWYYGELCLSWSDCGTGPAQGGREARPQRVARLPRGAYNCEPPVGACHMISRHVEGRLGWKTKRRFTRRVDSRALPEGRWTRAREDVDFLKRRKMKKERIFS